MLAAHLDPLAASIFSLLAIVSLLLAFVMLGSRWLSNYLYAFAAQSWLIAMLSAAVGFYGGYPELYLIAILTALFRGLLLPYLILRIIRRLDVAREMHVILQASSSLVIGAFAVVFALAVSYHIGSRLGFAGTVVVLALTVMLSMKLIGFLMLAVRHEAISQILGLLVLENGIFLGAQILVPGMPLLIEIVILFDLLIVVACFGVLVQYLVAHVGTTSSLDLSGWWADDDRRAPPRVDARAGGGDGRICCIARRARPRVSISLPAIVVVRGRGPARGAERARAVIFSGRTMSSSTCSAPGSILCTAVVYLLASIYAIGYMRLLGEDERLQRFYALFAGFALTMLLSR